MSTITRDSKESTASSPTPLLTPLSRNLSGYFSVPFERFTKDEAYDWADAFTLLDTVETYFDSHIDLLERRFKKHSDKIRMRAEEALRRTKSPSAELLNALDVEREMQKWKLKLSNRMGKLATTWQSAKVVRTREKISFFFGVMNLLISALLLGMAPEWIHVSYTIQGLYLLPLRAYTYKRKAWHYFLFDFCYYITILNYVYLWLAPDSPELFIACYCTTLGSLASAVITWRNSLVFHDGDKVTSLFIHIYPVLTFTTIRHFYPDAAIRFPAIQQLPTLPKLTSFLYTSILYIIWQGLYWKFVLINRKSKIESGQRTTSFSFLLNDQRGFIGKTLNKIPPGQRTAVFMFGQLIYSIVTQIPAVFLLYDSKFWSAVYLLGIFSVSVWNGGGYYIEVFGRKFEKELESLRKELAEATASRSESSLSLSSTPDGEGSPVDGNSDDEDLRRDSPITVGRTELPNNVEKPASLLPETKKTV